MSAHVARPVKLCPRLDAKPWGGRRLAEWGVDLPSDEIIGEALLTAPEATIASGPCSGMKLGELARLAPDRWVGSRGLEATGNRVVFPLLIKLIDGQDDLSIQVHPDDRAAAAAGLGTGKTEAYHILVAEPGNVIYLGLDSEQESERFAEACLNADGSAAGFLRRVPAVPGMTVLIPAGTPHALGAGIVVYEIQQPSNVTFRLDDWGRIDAAGEHRPLHHSEGLPLIDPTSHPEPIPRVPVEMDAMRRAILVATRYFALERIAFSAHHVVRVLSAESPQVLTCIAGAATLDACGWYSSLATGETIVVPAGLPSALNGSPSSVVLRGWVPDLERDVVAPARVAGASDVEIERLGIHVGQRG